MIPASAGSWEHLDLRSSTRESRRSGFPTEASDHLPRGYWTKTDRMILRLQRGEKKLLWRIVERLEPIVRAVVVKVEERSGPSGLEEEDLLQIGRIEIIGLIGSYDPRSETRIYVYMRNYLYHRIVRVVDDSLPIRVPANFTSGSDLEQRATYFRSPTAYEQLEEIPEDAFVGEEGEFEEVLRKDLYLRIVMAPHLSERHRYVLEQRYGLNGRGEKTLEEVGARLDVTRERVRQVQLEATKALKAYIYLSFGLDTGLDLSTGRWRSPKVSPAVLHGDFFLGEPPERESSISAPAEWAGNILPHEKTP